MCRNADGLTEEEFLAQYKPSDYERPSVTVDMLVLCMNKYLENFKVLLIKRKDHPYIHQWALAGGFVNIDESAYQSACRELQEETGLTGVYLEQLYTMSQPNRDPRMRVIGISYMALMQEQPVKAGDDAQDALWFDVSVFNDKELRLWNEDNGIVISYDLVKKSFKNGVVNIDGFTTSFSHGDKLAFDHADIILEGLLRLRNKVMYSDVAFNLLPNVFTLSDAKRVYEVILGKELFTSNFKTDMQGKLEDLGYKVTSSVRNGKSAVAYRYRG